VKFLPAVEISFPCSREPGKAARIRSGFENEKPQPLKKATAFKAEWELRFGPHNRFRVFYRVEGEEVILLAFGEKKGNRLFIEGKEVER
jgi:hypothetical protein